MMVVKKKEATMMNTDKMIEKKIKDKICRTIAYALPTRILYWCIIRIWARMTGEIFTNKHPDEITWSMAIKNL